MQLLPPPIGPLRATIGAAKCKPRGLAPGEYKATDYVNGKDYGIVTEPSGNLKADFKAWQLVVRGHTKVWRIDGLNDGLL